jgi:hypothetical protein
MLRPVPAGAERSQQDLLLLDEPLSEGGPASRPRSLCLYALRGRDRGQPAGVTTLEEQLAGLEVFEEETLAAVAGEAPSSPILQAFANTVLACSIELDVYCVVGEVEQRPSETQPKGEANGLPHEHSPALAPLDPAITVLFCQIDDAYTTPLNPRGGGEGRGGGR